MAEESVTELLAAVRDSIDHLYDVHDRLHMIDKRGKDELLKKLQTEAIAQLTALKSTHWESSEKAQLHLLFGKALDAMREYNADAESHLQKAVKLDPTAWEAWNALGSVLFKKRDLRGSLDAFDASAAIKPNIPALRDASIVLRQVPDRSAVVENIRLSVVKAKAAVALDLKNVETWTVLGTAHLATYFAVSRDVDDLQRANQAYHRAATLEAALLSGGGARPDAPKPRVPGSWEPVAPRPDPDLHYNRGQAFTFQEAYDAAIQEYLMTLATDPQLPAKENLEKVRTHVARIVSLIARKGHVKTKRLREVNAALAAPPSAAESALIGARTCVTLAGLALGSNPGKALRLRALAPVAKSDAPPATLVCVDSAGVAFALSIYFLKEEHLSSLSDRESITVLDPVLRPVHVDLGVLDAVLDGEAAYNTEVSVGAAAAAVAAHAAAVEKGSEAAGAEGGAAAKLPEAVAAAAPASGAAPVLRTPAASFQCIQVQLRASLILDGRAMDARGALPAPEAPAGTMHISATP